MTHNPEDLVVINRKCYDEIKSGIEEMEAIGGKTLWTERMLILLSKTKPLNDFRGEAFDAGTVTDYDGQPNKSQFLNKPIEIK